MSSWRIQPPIQLEPILAADQTWQRAAVNRQHILRYVMKFFSAILLLACVARAELPAGWNSNYAETLSEATNKQQSALIYFTAIWCGPCKLMSRLTLTNTLVVQALSDIPHAAIDIDDEREL